MSPLSMASSSSRGPSATTYSNANANDNASAQAGQPPTPSAKSHRTFASVSIDRDYASEMGATEHEAYGDADMGMNMADDAGEAVHFCLLAEFDIDAGATLSDQYPHPTGTDEQ
jgi:hypothetical protein